MIGRHVRTAAQALQPAVDQFPRRQRLFARRHRVRLLEQPGPELRGRFGMVALQGSLFRFGGQAQRQHRDGHREHQYARGAGDGGRYRHAVAAHKFAELVAQGRRAGVHRLVDHDQQTGVVEGADVVVQVGVAARDARGFAVARQNRLPACGVDHGRGEQNRVGPDGGVIVPGHAARREADDHNRHAKPLRKILAEEQVPAGTEKAAVKTARVKSAGRGLYPSVAVRAEEGRFARQQAYSHLILTPRTRKSGIHTFIINQPRGMVDCISSSSRPSSSSSTSSSL